MKQDKILPVFPQKADFVSTNTLVMDKPIQDSINILRDKTYVNTISGNGKQ